MLLCDQPLPDMWCTYVIPLNLTCYVCDHSLPNMWSMWSPCKYYVMYVITLSIICYLCVPDMLRMSPLECRHDLRVLLFFHSLENSFDSPLIFDLSKRSACTLPSRYHQGFFLYKYFRKYSPSPPRWGHFWKNEKVTKFCGRCLRYKGRKRKNKRKRESKNKYLQVE